MSRRITTPESQIHSDEPWTLRLAEGQPARLAVQWASGRVDSLSVRGERLGETAQRQLRELVREISDCSPQIARVWLEDEHGALLYAAQCGQAVARKPPIA